jgi:arylsulfatase A-like enzyme
MTGDRRRLTWELILLGSIFGACAGFAHVLVVLYRRDVLNQFTGYPRDVVWMSPLGNALIIAGVALPFALAQVLRPSERVERVAIVILAATATVGALLSFRGLTTWSVGVLGLGAGVAFSRLQWGHRLIRRGTAVAALAIAACAAWSISAQRESAVVGARPADAPNILVVIFDTVRAASTSLNGYARGTTPQLDRLAAEGATFDLAISPAPWTLPSHAAMFTGYSASKLSARWTVPLDAARPTIAEHLRKRGYATGAFVGNLTYTNYESGLGRGFGIMKDFRRSPAQMLLSTTFGQAPFFNRIARNPTLVELEAAVRHFRLRTPWELKADRRHATEVADDFLAWSRRTNRPWFAFVNFYDAHEPYVPPDSLRTLFARNPSLQDLYDAGIVYADQELGRLIDSLKTRGELDRTVVVVTSDHGQHFDEHGLRGHGHSLYLQAVHVPLAVRFPPRVPAGIRVRQAVSLTDLAATIESISGNANGTFPGQSLLRACCGGGYTTRVITETERVSLGWPPRSPARAGALAALFTDSVEYIRSGDSAYQLFDIRRDYAQNRNLLRDPGGCGRGIVADSILRSLAALPASPPLDPVRCSAQK